MQRLISSSCAIILVCAHAGLAQAQVSDVFVDGYTNLRFEDNPASAILEAEEQPDFSALVGVSAARAIQLGDNAGVLGRVAIEYHQPLRFEDMRHHTLKGAVDMRYQVSRAPLSPWFRGLATAALREYPRSRIRSGLQVRLEPSMGKRLTDRIEVSAAYAYDYRTTPEGKTFNVKGHTIAAELNYDFNPRLVLFGRVSRRWGDSTSTVRVITRRLRMASRGFQPDRVFASDGTAWRFKSISDAVHVGADYDIDDANFVSLSAGYRYANATLGDDYNRWSGFLSYQRRFQ